MSGYKFPRRSDVRFVMIDGECCGSGNIKKYDDDTACIGYMYIDEGTEKADELSGRLLDKLEKDAVRAGYKEIFVLAGSDASFYLSHGYTECPRKDDDRLADILGARVIYDKTLTKELMNDSNNTMKGKAYV